MKTIFLVARAGVEPAKEGGEAPRDSRRLPLASAYFEYVPCSFARAGWLLNLFCHAKAGEALGDGFFGAVGGGDMIEVVFGELDGELLAWCAPILSQRPAECGKADALSLCVHPIYTGGEFSLCGEPGKNVCCCELF